LDATIPPHSIASRTVYVKSSDPLAKVVVDVAEVVVPSTPTAMPPLVPGGFTGTVLLNPDVVNPDVVNPDVVNQTFEAAVSNPDVVNPDVVNGTLVDVTWTVQNTGNTTGTFAVKPFLAKAAPKGVVKQLLLYKTYSTPVVVNSPTEGCVLRQQSQTVLVSNVRN